MYAFMRHDEHLRHNQHLIMRVCESLNHKNVLEDYAQRNGRIW